MDEEQRAVAYTLNVWDCPYCGYQNMTDRDLGSAEDCEDCGKEVGIDG